ncbi:thioesterase [Gymnopus androsaceus JB14]|uniref:Thioesterase n=1 Tax=Gymnopus androsaceus JB14 TaxID=1447944 RepID=A0A6A4HVF9_9AGAR|nr:thioesterase [Gymnopus androsaceus JB14]
MTETLKALRRADFRYSLSYRTRWSDNDQYSHINNSIYYHLFDSIVNTYLIESCGQKSLTIAFNWTGHLIMPCFMQFFAPLSFPEVLDLCLRVKKLGNSSVTYEIGVFQEGTDSPAAVGGYTHVFVDRDSRKSTSMQTAIREGLGKLLVELRGVAQAA